MKELDALFRRRVQINKKESEEAYFRAGIISSVIANCHRDPKQKKEPYKPQDFMPQEGKEKEKQSHSDQIKIVEILNAALGGKDKRGGAN